jgi:outer membrane biosynthesis protein TonB
MRLSIYIKSVIFVVAIFGSSTVLHAQELATNNNEGEFSLTQHEAAFVIPPKPTNYLEIQKSMVYPVSCRRLGIEGKITAKILVDKDGKTSKFELMNNLHPELNAVCKEKIMGLKFESAKNQHGDPIERWVVVPFHFKLNI